MMKRIAIGIFLLAMSAGAWAQAEKLGVGDAIHVTVFQQPDLTTDARISEKGSIAMPLIGEVKVAGLSQPEAAAQIARTEARFASALFAIGWLMMWLAATPRP